MSETKTRLSSGFWGRGLHHASDLLIRRGTAMGPLVPFLLLSPLFLASAFLLRGVPLLAGMCVVVAIGIALEYSRQFARFAKRDPDRLQSEEYRYGMKRIQLIAAKELPYPMPAEALALPVPISNPAQPAPDLSHIPELADGQLETEK